MSKLLKMLIDSTNILFLNQDPRKLVSKITLLLDKTLNKDLIRYFYCLILSLCFYANENKNQRLFIS